MAAVAPCRALSWFPAVLCRVVRVKQNNANARACARLLAFLFNGRYAFPSGAASASGLIVMSNSCNI